MTDDERNLGERIGQMDDRLASIEQKLDALIITVRGDRDYGARGLSPRVDELEKRIARVEAIINRVLWLATGAGLAGYGVGELIRQLLSG